MPSFSLSTVRPKPKRKQVKAADDRPASAPAAGTAITATTDEGYGRVCELRERAFTKNTLHPSAGSARTIRKIVERQLGYVPDLTLDALTQELDAQSAEVSTGNLGRPEGLLMSQAQTLDAVFHHLTQQAYDNINNVEIAERWLRLAFRAQSQSRAAIETLGYLRNPTMVFAKQANLTSGPQQVNNNSISRTRETEIVQNELLETNDAERLEQGPANRAAPGNTAVAAMAEIDRAKNR